MLIIDSHLDLAWNAVRWNRDLRLSAYTIRTLERSAPGPGGAQGTVALPELRRGRVALSFATVMARSRVPPSSAVAPIVTSRTEPGQLSFTNSIGIVHSP